MKIYEGTRQGGSMGDGVVFIVENGKRRPLPPRNDLRNHSPDGFEWGYGGSGPAQLALALCADATGDDELAQRVYQDVKFKLIATINTDTWMLSASDLLKAIAKIEEGC